MRAKTSSRATTSLTQPPCSATGVTLGLHAAPELVFCLSGRRLVRAGAPRAAAEVPSLSPRGRAFDDFVPGRLRGGGGAAGAGGARRAAGCGSAGCAAGGARRSGAHGSARAVLGTVGSAFARPGGDGG